ncbi:DsbC family protein [Leeia sp. TBRC 13508]|uniref:Thiol:disulfide interchange protein n=1 Tax=Leeia speluncae TaxID=2884804 RepID=A0ABS8D6M0_9NEIS|nr:DsbC family protein [Leeia speluncae]MCB6183817.1 DsbC family protein [Leeia speluncae]
MIGTSSFLRTVKHFTLTTLAIACLTACGAGNAAPAPNKELDQVKKLVATKLTKVKVNAVSATPVAGVYEVVFNDENIVYVDSKVEHLFQGELISLKDKESLTANHQEALSKAAEEKRAKARVDVVKSFPIDQAIRVEKGNGKRVMYVFSDPDCPFCYKLEETLKEIDNVTVYTFLFPLAQLHPDAPRKSALIWCASDRAAAWQKWMDQPMESWRAMKNLPDNKGTCDTPIQKIQELGNRLGVQGTPAIFFPDGTLMPGAYPKEEIEKELAKQK